MLRPSLSARIGQRLRRGGQGVSPEFMLRPSLSVGRLRRLLHGRCRVAGVYAPAFVERVESVMSPASRSTGVAGVYAPAFVERGRRSRGVALDVLVSPEFMLRPSLSVRRGDDRQKPAVEGVAGVYAPAFVERRRLAHRPSPIETVSPEFMLRPSLSEEARRARVVRRRVSPEFMLRPSLSGPEHRDTVGRVSDLVSPEFMLRPSLSVRRG